MEKQQWVNIIYHQATIRCQEKGLLFGSLSQKEQYQIMYEISLEFLCELGDNNE